MKHLLIFILFLMLCLPGKSQNVKWLDELNVDYMSAGWSNSKANKSIAGNPLKVAGSSFQRGVGTHAVSSFLIDLNSNAQFFKAQVGVDDEIDNGAGSLEFVVMGDKKILWRSNPMKKGDAPKDCNLPLTGIKKLALIVLGLGDSSNDHADWLNAQIGYKDICPVAIKQITPPETPPYVLTPKVSPFPRINGAKVFGARPGNPFLFKVAVTGKRPMTITASGLPNGLSIDSKTGIITGTTPAKGEYIVKLTAQNSLGKATRNLKIVSGDLLALTPPMGWNSWNCWGLSVDQEKVKASANAMINKGLIEHGWTFINIDDGWEAPERASDGTLNPNAKFPNMKELTNYIHSQGLKMGIYSSPGPKTCGGFLGTYLNEHKDANTWADWGIDYIKYDWCSYTDVAKDWSLGELQKPYFVMQDALKKCHRDIVYSLCQYGWGNVWEWGAKVSGNLWRTTGDITDTWTSMSGIGFSQLKNTEFAGPGHWNDPDMLIVGKVGWGPSLHNTHLTPDEQYTHITLWSLLAAPLLIGCDMSQLDDFTLNLLCNDEVIEVNQDPLGKQASPVKNSNGIQIWMRP
ncbi:MAG: NPCBM/NEW2 domain-containing protein, partial [Bacteroidota bacterium]|nr:NPCBM/NEW2 domain-containing protein [Bacteroidota bacterium]